MATVLKRILRDGSHSYKIQSKAKDPMTGEYKYFSETWRKPPTMSEYQAKRELEKRKYELDEKAKTEVQGLTAFVQFQSPPRKLCVPRRRNTSFPQGAKYCCV